MPFNSKEKQKEYSRQYYQRKKCGQANTNIDFGTQTDPIPKIVKVIRPKSIASAEIETQTDEGTPSSNAFTDNVRSVLKVGEKYISLHPSPTNPAGVPLFFRI